MNQFDKTLQHETEAGKAPFQIIEPLRENARQRKEDQKTKILNRVVEEYETGSRAKAFQIYREHLLTNRNHWSMRLKDTLVYFNLFITNLKLTK